MAPQNLAVEEPDGDLAGGRLGGQIAIDRHLDPLHGGHGDPRRLVVLEPGCIVDLDQEVGLVEVEIASRPLKGLVVEEPDDHASHCSPSVISLIWPRPCGWAFFRSCGCTWGRRRCGAGQPLPAAAGACRRCRAPAAARPPRGSARPPPPPPRTPP